MRRRDFLKAVGLGAAALTVPGAMRLSRRHAAGTFGPRPNFVFILVDDLGWTDLGCYGNTFCETPNIDRLAASGMRFTDAYAASPVCSPTRASILTGKHPARLGITNWIPGRRPRDRKLISPRIRKRLPPKEVTVAEALKQAGYATFFAGKWHLGGEGSYPEDQGFDINKGGHAAGGIAGRYYVPYGNPKLEDGPEGEYLPDRLTDEAIRFLDGQSDNPFLLYLAFYSLHAPIVPCRRHIDRFRRKAEALRNSGDSDELSEPEALTRQRQHLAAYASMVYALDENIGRLLNKLGSLGLADSTVVILVSDNGGLATRSGKEEPTRNLPLRAGKGWCYEGGIRVPLIIRAPEVTDPGSLCHVPVVSMDFYPTILELAGLRLRPSQHCDGLSLMPVLKGTGRPERQAIFWHYPHYGAEWTPSAAVRAGDWKLIEFCEQEKIELYNLKDDLGERSDLADKLPDKKAELLAQLHGWQRSVGAQLARPNPNYNPKSEGTPD